MLYNDAHLTTQQFGHVLSPEFPGAVSSLNLLKAPPLFVEYLTIEYLISLFNSNAVSKEPREDLH